MAGASLLVSTPSYGNDASAWRLLAVVLASLDDARRSGIRVQVELDLTHSPPPTFRVPDGLPVTQYLHDPKVKLGLAGMYRPRFWAASGAARYDYYLMMDNDVNVTRDNLEVLCVHSNRLAGTNLMPGLLRFETLADDVGAPRFLQDMALRSPPHISSVVHVRGEAYVVPHNPMQASWFLPRARLACVLRKLEQHGGWGSDWQQFHHNGSLEFFESLWLMPWFVTVVPSNLRAAERHLVHHLTNKYTRRTDVTMAAPRVFFEAAANFSGRPITVLGPRRRRPASKLRAGLGAGSRART